MSTQMVPKKSKTQELLTKLLFLGSASIFALEPKSMFDDAEKYTIKIKLTISLQFNASEKYETQVSENCKMTVNSVLTL